MLVVLHNLLSKSEFLLVSNYGRASHISSNSDFVGAVGCFPISIENETFNNVFMRRNWQIFFFTCRPQEIDEAARRRLVKRLYIPLPDAGAREQIMCSLLSQQKCSLSQQNMIKIVQRTHGMCVK